MQELIDGLDGVDWLVSAKKLHNLLKPKFQTKDEVIRAFERGFAIPCMTLQPDVAQYH